VTPPAGRWASGWQAAQEIPAPAAADAADVADAADAAETAGAEAAGV
jgi:hypothetical protein